MPWYLFTYEKFLKTYVSEYVTGLENELFMNHAVSQIDNTLGINPYSENYKENLRLTAAGKHAYFLSKDIPFYLFQAPDKATLYAEKLPFYAEWITHNTWHKDEVSSLRKANIRFYQLNDLLQQFKGDEKLFDFFYDNYHWNGSAIVHAYQYIAKILAKDNPIFRPVPYPEYYDLENVPVTESVYGSEQTKFIKLKHTEDYSCSLPPEEYRTFRYNTLCFNNHVKHGGLWVFSDSYFGWTHGSYGPTPFVHSVHNYLLRHYMSTKPFTQLSDETLKLFRPDAVIEEFVVSVGGPQNSSIDPLLRILGDCWMKTNGIFLEHRTDFSAFELENIDHGDSAPDALVMKPGSRLSLKAPAAADDLGRVVVMGKISAPAGARVRISWRDESGADGTQDFSIAEGAHIFHETVHLKPFSKVRLSLQFLTSGKYRLDKIQEIDDLRERM